MPGLIPFYMSEIGTTVSHGSTPARCFATTHWSVVLTAGQASATEAAEALDKLCRTYWLPLYSFVRRSGYDEQTAKDLTQGFFEQFLARHDLGQVDRGRGKFRSFLLASMKHFLANQWDHANRQKRGGDYAFVPWDEATIETQFQPQVAPNLPPESSYDRQWALTVLDRVFARLRDECSAAGKRELFEGLEIYLSGEKSAESYSEAAARLTMTAGSVQVAVHRLRRRYGELLREEIAHTVSRPDEVDEEIRHLFAAVRSDGGG